MRAKRDGEIDQQNVIMHKAYYILRMNRILPMASVEKVLDHGEM